MARGRQGLGCCGLILTLWRLLQSWGASAACVPLVPQKLVTGYGVLWFGGLWPHLCLRLWLDAGHVTHCGEDVDPEPDRGSAEHTPATVKWEDADLGLGAWGLSAYVVP